MKMKKVPNIRRSYRETCIPSKPFFPIRHHTYKPVSLVRLHFKNPRSAIAVPLRVNDPSQSSHLSRAYTHHSMAFSLVDWNSPATQFLTLSHPLHSPSAFLSRFLTFFPPFHRETCSRHLMVGDSKTLHP